MSRAIIQDRASRLYFHHFEVKTGLKITDLRKNALRIASEKSGRELVELLSYHFGCFQWRLRRSK